jgi:LacI family transcriptional regulator
MLSSMGEPKKGASLADVAALAGVSTATAARVLGGYGTAHSKNAEAIRAAAMKLGYARNLAASGIKTGRSRLLALLISDVENQFFGRLTTGVADAAKREGYQLIVANTNESTGLELDAIHALRERQVDGFIVVPAFRSGKRFMAAIRDSGTPVVFIDRDIAELRTDAVTVNNRAAARDLVRVLIAEGHTRIAFIADSPGSGKGMLENPTSSERRRGYEDALTEAGIDVVAPYIRTSDYRVSSAQAETNALFDLPTPPTALFTSDSMMTLGAMAAVRERGLVVGTDVSLVAFDDPDWARLIDPPLTVLAQPARRMGETAAERLILRISEPELEPAKIVLPTELILRGSHRLHSLV